MKNSMLQKFIISMTLLVMMVSVIGSGLDGSTFVTKQGDLTDIVEYMLESQLSTGDTVSNMKIAERGSVLASVWQMRIVRSNFSARISIFCLFALTLMSGLFLFSLLERLILCCNLCVSKICYQVTYIELQDGQK